MKRKVKKEEDDYAFREYGLTQRDLMRLSKAVEKEYQRLKRSGKLVTFTEEQLKKMAEEAARD